MRYQDEARGADSLRISSFSFVAGASLSANGSQLTLHQVADRDMAHLETFVLLKSHANLIGRSQRRGQDGRGCCAASPSA